MYLCIEMIAPGYVSLAHYGQQNGDAMRDPDVILWGGLGHRVGWDGVSQRLRER